MQNYIIAGVVLAVAVIIVLISNRKKPANESAPTPIQAAPAAQSAAAQTQTPAAAAGQSISPKTVAAIMAAITAASGGANLRFISIRRTRTTRNPYADSGTLQIISERQQY